MPSLKYLGPDAVDAGDILGKLQTDNGFSGGVSSARLTEKVDAAVAPLATKTYVDNQDGLLVPQSYVDNQDGLNVPNTSVGIANGVASLDASGKVPLSQISTSSLALAKIRGPYLFSWVGSAPPESYYDDAGQWDQAIGSITIPAPGGSSVWRPLIFGRFEVYNSGGTGRTDVFATGSGYELARGCGRNGGSAQAYPVTVVPRSDANAQTPGGWSASTGMTINFFVRSVFQGTRGGIVYGGSWNAWAFLVRL